MIFNTILRILSGNMHVILDPEDGSVTLGKKMWKRIQKDCKGIVDDVMMFKTNEGKYAFTVNPYDTILQEYAGQRDRSTSPVQQNMKYKCIGFMPDKPTVASIYYDKNLPDTKIKATVRRVKAKTFTYYVIEL